LQQLERIKSLRPAGQNYRDPISKIKQNKNKRARDVVQMVERLPNMRKALGSNSKKAKKKGWRLINAELWNTAHRGHRVNV
jgi:hypothetical protein